MKNIFFSIFIISCLTSQVSNLSAQNNVGIGTITPNTKALLDLTANNKGVLVPRLTSVDRLAINPTGTADAALLVYDTDSNLFFFWNSTQWIPFPKQGSNNISLNFDANTGILSLTDDGGTLTTNIPPDNDSDPNNELITGVVFNANGNILTINEGGNTWSTAISIVDPDSDPTNEYNTALSFNSSNNILSVTDAGGTINTNLASLANDWKLLGNAGTNPATNFLGTTDAQDLVLRTNNAERIRVSSNTGFVGIGTANPLVNLEVNGSSMINIAGASDGGRMIWRGGTGGLQEYRARLNTAGYLGFFPVEFGNPGYVGDVLSLTQAGNVGVNTTTPTDKLQVVGNVRIGAVAPSGSPGTNTPAGGSVLFLSGANAMGGFDSDNSDPIGIYRFNQNTDESYLILGVGDLNNTTDGVVFQNYGSAWSHFFRSDGLAQKAGGGNWGTLSDKRLKHNITHYNDGLNILEKINPVRYQYTNNVNINTLDKQYIGIIAQEVQTLAPYMIEDAVKGWVKDGREDYLAVDPSAFTYMLINAVKELNAKIEMLEKENSELSSLKAEVEKLKSIIYAESKK